MSIKKNLILTLLCFYCCLLVNAQVNNKTCYPLKPDQRIALLNNELSDDSNYAVMITYHDNQYFLKFGETVKSKNGQASTEYEIDNSKVPPTLGEFKKYFTTNAPCPIGQSEIQINEVVLTNKRELRKPGVQYSIIFKLNGSKNQLIFNKNKNTPATEKTITLKSKLN